MAKKQNKRLSLGLTAFDEVLALDASNQGPTRNDIEKVKNTPSSAYFAARVAYVVGTLLRTANQNLDDIWTDQNMDKVSRKAGQIASLPLQMSESAATALYEGLLKPLGKATGVKVTPPKEKKHDNNDDDHDTDSDDNDNHGGLTQDEIDALHLEIGDKYGAPLEMFMN